MQPYAPLGYAFTLPLLSELEISLSPSSTPCAEAPQPGFSNDLTQLRPRIVAIYEDDFNFLSKMCLTRMRELAWELAHTAQAAGAVVIAHGSDATDQAEAYLRNGVDFVLRGEAEQTLVDLCSSILTGHPHLKIPGLVYLDAADNPVQSANLTPKNTSWNTLPKPARELIDFDSYRQAWITAHGHFSANVVASRGCPYRCNWCAKPISGNKFQIRPASMRRGRDTRIERNGRRSNIHIWFGDDVFRTQPTLGRGVRE